MNTLSFYFDHSLLGYFFQRTKKRWFTPPAAQVNHYGVNLQVDCLPKEMQEVIHFGDYEGAEMKILPGFISSEDKILEIGGAIGFIGLYCRKIVGVKDLISVEPNPKTLSYLRQNYELNGFTPSIIEAAMTAIDGPVQFQTSDMFWSDSLIPKPGTVATQIITVEGLSFANILKRAGVQFNTLIIDIEGGEQYLSLNLLPGHVTKVLIEIHPDIIGVRQAYNILEILICSGFKVQGHYWNAWALKRS
jgi:FkbM family methyltransferase